MIRFIEDPEPRRAPVADDRPALLREVASLRARVAELEAAQQAHMEALLAVNTANTANAVSSVSTAVNTPANSRTAYMRDYMRRRRALKNKNSPSV